MDPITGGLIATGVGGLFGLGGSLSTNAANKEIAEMNIDYQKETNAKNEALMRESWGRDDNAVQRRAKDLMAAGMSPLLAAGSAAGNANVVSMHAPESKQVVNQSGLQGALSGIYQGLMAQQSMMDQIAKQQQIAINQNQLALNSKDQEIREWNAPVDRELTTARSRDLFFDYQLKQKSLDTRIDREHKITDLRKLEEANKLLQLEADKYNLDMSKKHGLRTNETGTMITKTAQQLSSAIKRAWEQIF